MKSWHLYFITWNGWAWYIQVYPFEQKNMFLVFTDLFKIFHSKTNPVAGVRPFLTLKIFALCKEVQDSLGFWIPHRRFWIPVSAFQSLSMELRLRILIFCGIPDSKTLGFWDPDSLTWGETFFCSNKCAYYSCWTRQWECSIYWFV